MALINPGRKAPDFKLSDQHGERHTLKNYAGRSVVLYFYPKDDTSDCTAQACQFRDAHPDFSHVKASVLGISPDDADSHRMFAEKHALDFPLLADTRADDSTPGVCAAYGVWQEKSMYGRKYLGVIRTTYLIGPDGVVVRRWDKVKVSGHASEVLAAVKALHSGEMIEAKPTTRSRGATREPAKKAPRTRSGAGRRARSGDSDPPFAPLRGPRKATVNRVKTKGQIKTKSGKR